MDQLRARVAMILCACALVLPAASLTTSRASHAQGGYTQQDFDREYQETVAQLLFWLNKKCLDQATIDALSRHAEEFLTKWYPLGTFMTPPPPGIHDYKRFPPPGISGRPARLQGRLKTEVEAQQFSTDAVGGRTIEKLRNLLQSHKCPPP